jgi:hypothetical protein
MIILGYVFFLRKQQKGGKVNTSRIFFNHMIYTPVTLVLTGSVFCKKEKREENRKPLFAQTKEKTQNSFFQPDKESDDAEVLK